MNTGTRGNAGNRRRGHSLGDCQHFRMSGTNPSHGFGRVLSTASLGYRNTSAEGDSLQLDVDASVPLLESFINVGSPGRDSITLARAILNRIVR